MRPPRRIFRSKGRPHVPLTRHVVLTAAVVSAAVIAMAGLPSDLFGRTAPPAERMWAEPAEVMVVDGDTLRVGLQVVRLRGVVAPSRDDSCPGKQDCGSAAASALAGFVRRRRVDCRLAGRDGGGRPLATCEAGGLDLGRAMVSSGWARAGSDEPELADLELLARRDGGGLWAGGTR